MIFAVLLSFSRISDITVFQAIWVSNVPKPAAYASISISPLVRHSCYSLLPVVSIAERFGARTVAILRFCVVLQAHSPPAFYISFGVSKLPIASATHPTSCVATVRHVSYRFRRVGVPGTPIFHDFSCLQHWKYSGVHGAKSRKRFSPSVTTPSDRRNG